MKYFLTLFVGLLAASCANAANHGMKNIVETAQANDAFSTLVAAVVAGGLAETLSGPGPFTVFAPPNDAFAALPDGTVEELLKPENKDTLVGILTYHVVPGKIMSSDLSEPVTVQTVSGMELTINPTEETVTVGNAQVTEQYDIECSNGVIHVVNAVILPPGVMDPSPEEPTMDIPALAVSAGVFNTLLAAVEAADLVDTLSSPGPFTVFAPTDEAFAKLPAGTVEDLLKPENKDQLTDLLLYHVISGMVTSDMVTGDMSVPTAEGTELAISVKGEEVYVGEGGAKVTDMYDVMATNGVVHVIDAVLMIPAPPAPTKNIPELAVEAGVFKTLVAALTAADLVTTLSGDGPFTVFAPTDDAFAKLPAGTVDDLLKPENKAQLTSILTYHVLPGKIMSSDLKEGTTTVATVQGSDVDVVVGASAVKYGTATVNPELYDVEATNGVVHVIDSVVMPPAPAMAPPPAETPAKSTPAADDGSNAAAFRVSALGLVAAAVAMLF
eukprot:CAMPEP_0197844250 /NCGR_PEP_ID=MMETSP1438-20131217/1242_1 /TAXON_ID=1461541 /ORGANISM="Pterosperma sp., Strain CCMP1384" /LENGTH=497 /DNA_ID=CAMNT_0043454949 /DNA_START=84 /DNA_END=1577 /DNA_ORIENTATION=+